LSDWYYKCLLVFLHCRVDQEQQERTVQPADHERAPTILNYNIKVKDSATVTAIAGNVGRDTVASGCIDRPQQKSKTKDTAVGDSAA
jgi:hypothetical protein